MRKFNVNVNGKIYVVEIEETDLPAPVAEEKKAEPAPKREAPKTAGKTNVNAPMPGTILETRVKVGDTVKAGPVLCILDAMKMENEMTAPSDGTVTFVIAKGASVNTGDTLAALS